MPKVTASVSADDVRRAYYESAGYSMWITEMQLDPLQLIVCDDATGKFYRVPVTLSGDQFEFGAQVEVSIQYIDVGKKTSASAIVWASRDESRDLPTTQPPAPPKPAARPVTPAVAARQIHNAPVAGTAHGPIPDQKEGSTMDLAKLREGLGLGADLSDEQVQAALDAAGITVQPAPPPDPADPPGDPVVLASKVPTLAGSDAVLLDPAQYNALRTSAMRGEDAWRKMRENECEAVLDEAIRAGKFPPGRRDHWKALWAADPDGTKATIDKLAANVIPVMATGYPGVTDESEVDLVYASMYPEARRA
jgi:hypothetical protein